MIDLTQKTVAIVGLGYVGLPLAVEFGKVRRTIGFDLRRERIEALRSGRDTTLEVEAADLAAATSLTYTCRREDLKGCGVYIVAVPTPIDRANRPDLTLLVKASETVGAVMEKGAIVVYEFHGLSRLHARGVRARVGARLRSDVQ